MTKRTQPIFSKKSINSLKKMLTELNKKIELQNEKTKELTKARDQVKKMCDAFLN